MDARWEQDLLPFHAVIAVCQCLLVSCSEIESFIDAEEHEAVTQYGLGF